MTNDTVCEEQRDEIPKDESDSPVDMESLPIYTSVQVTENNGQDGKPIWMSYGGVVYDVTNFISNHPGGSEMILKAAGSAIEPFWHVYRQHFASDLPLRLMERMAVGQLAEDDQDVIDEQMAEREDDPFEKEPERDNDHFIIHSDTPMNAECPDNVLSSNYITPGSLFYIRHHHQVPFLSEDEMEKYELEIDLSAYGRGVLKLSLEDLKKMRKVEVTSTLQCSGNRRSGYNKFQKTSGTAWGQGAISTAKWGGVRLIDVMKLAGLDDAIDAAEKGGMQHVRFYGLDGMEASIGIEKALNPYGDCLICYEMNGEPLPREHGSPLRMIVPGYVAVRNVKWLNKIELAKTEAEGPWQRGLNYKTLPPSVTDAKEIKIEDMPSMIEGSVFSGITKIKRSVATESAKPGDKILMKVSGWAWAGGGRNIVRVDVTSDEGKNWTTASVKEGSDQRFGRAWAWVFWECEVNCTIQDDGYAYLASKALDSAFNVQPESCEHTWNVRGLGNNSWYRVSTKLVQDA
eukprot:CAMPEP_0194242688 /NCGR_PEP_ID=MMETSP0158-20130606/8146_1 /TAXON_ID=33649 /ORGANISM="Thalassionema nitzschioides, Strain L26-B" /LENGTH=514 /DNA_ID=CAMNT_0038977831 /DNA_START=240 /DNA_END=1784 /DNA_ORIENTATION=-